MAKISLTVPFELEEAIAFLLFNYAEAQQCSISDAVADSIASWLTLGTTHGMEPTVENPPIESTRVDESFVTIHPPGSSEISTFSQG